MTLKQRLRDKEKVLYKLLWWQKRDLSSFSLENTWYETLGPSAQGCSLQEMHHKNKFERFLWLCCFLGDYLWTNECPWQAHQKAQIQDLGLPSFWIFPNGFAKITFTDLGAFASLPTCKRSGNLPQELCPWGRGACGCSEKGLVDAANAHATLFHWQWSLLNLEFVFFQLIPSNWRVLKNNAGLYALWRKRVVLEFVPIVNGFEISRFCEGPVYARADHLHFCSGASTPQKSQVWPRKKFLDIFWKTFFEWTTQRARQCGLRSTFSISWSHTCVCTSDIYCLPWKVEFLFALNIVNVVLDHCIRLFKQNRNSWKHPFPHNSKLLYHFVIMNC